MRFGPLLRWAQAGQVARLEPPVSAYVNGERQLVRRATDLLVSAGIDNSAIASKAYWRHDQPNTAHGEPSHD